MNVISDDPYVYPPPHHNVLRNLADIRQAEAFSKFETRATARRIASLIEEPIPGNFDTGHLRAIHRHIFQDVYAWAGEYRTGPLMKSEYIGAPVSTFAPSQRIATELIALFRNLADKDCLKGLPRTVFTHEAARFLCQLNSVHPFREGNVERSSCLHLNLPNKQDIPSILESSASNGCLTPA